MPWADGDRLTPANLNFKSRGSQINPRDETYNADASGAEDSAATLQAAANALSSSGGGDLLIDGLYQIQSSVTLGPYTRVLGIGRGTIHCSTTSSGLIVSAGSAHVEGLRITGSATTETDTVIGLTLTDNCVVRNSEFSGWNINIQVQGSNCLVDGNIIHESLGSQSGQGYGTIVLSPEARVVNNVYKQTDRHGVYFSGSVALGGATRSIAANNIIEMSDISGGASGLKAFANGSQATLDGVVFSNNIIRFTNPGTVALGIEFNGTVANSVAEGNTIIDSTSQALRIHPDASSLSEHPQRCSFVGNVVSSQTGFFIAVNTTGGNVPLENNFVGNVRNRSGIGATAVTDSGTSTHITGNVPYPDSHPGHTLLSTDATPSVWNARYLRTGNGSATTITYFDNGRQNQEVMVRVADANTNFESSASLRLKGDADISAVSGDIYSFILGDTVWYETSRNTT